MLLLNIKYDVYLSRLEYNVFDLYITPENIFIND